MSKTKTAVSKPSRAKRGKKRQSLSTADWVNEAIEVLVTRSIEHVRLESLAKQLGATKGSFYWHFKNRAALLDAVIEEWTRQGTVEAVEWTKSGNATARQQLRRLLDFRSSRSGRWADLELAMRAWSRRSRPARLAALKVDRSRIEYVTGLFKEVGFDDQAAYARALIFYGTTQAVGRFTEIESLHAVFLDTILAMVLAEEPKR